MDDTSASYQLLTSVRYDSHHIDAGWNMLANDGIPTPIMLLRYHVDRLVSAAERHGWTNAARDVTATSLSSVCEAAVQRADIGQDVAYKVRVLLSDDGLLSATAAPLRRSGGRDILAPTEDHPDIRTIYLDPEPTSSSLFTSTKTTFRPHYVASRARVGLSPAPTPSNLHIDVLLHNSDGFLTETSIRNIAFRRNGVWLTPNVTTGCLPGVVRRYLIEQGQWIEAQDGELRLQDARDQELVMTANSVEGCYLGRIVYYPS